MLQAIASSTRVSVSFPLLYKYRRWISLKVGRLFFHFTDPETSANYHLVPRQPLESQWVSGGPAHHGGKALKLLGERRRAKGPTISSRTYPKWLNLLPLGPTLKVPCAPIAHRVQAFHMWVFVGHSRSNLE